MKSLMSTDEPSTSSTTFILISSLNPLISPVQGNGSKATESDEEILWKITMCGVALAMIACTLIGNALVCMAVLLVRKLRQPANLLLVSLAVADFFVGLIVMPLALVDFIAPSWPLGLIGCQIWTTADLTLCTASICNLCAISVDRYLAISRPLRYSAMRTNARVALYIMVVWVVSFFVSLTSLLITHFLDEETTNDSCQVTQNLGYQIYATLLAFYAPTMIMVILYVKIWRAAKRLAKQDKLLSYHTGTRASADSSNLLAAGPINGKNGSKFFHRPSALLNAVKYHARQHEKSETKARQTLGVMMSVFIICWLPFFSLALLKPVLELNVPWWLDLVTLWLGYSNSMLNPAIYCKYNKEFRMPFREMLFCRFRTLQTVMRQQSFTSKYGPTPCRAASVQDRAERPESSDL
ncbi:unnamed protein product, partial [Mesorhabditis belari]|uniref:G-protein coupled receptors family 1 profile domain-containing protein n=1 Tax=Mesorhabditis belari TaxID=2138241 RepID=A0AAF3ERK2_9BILA